LKYWLMPLSELSSIFLFIALSYHTNLKTPSIPFLNWHKKTTKFHIFIILLHAYGKAYRLLKK